MRRAAIGTTIGLISAWLVGATVAVGHALAQAADAAEDRASSFQAVTGAVKEDVAGGPLLLAAYAIVWIALFGYVWRLNSLQRGVQVNLERLERSLGRERSAAPASAVSAH